MAPAEKKCGANFDISSIFDIEVDAVVSDSESRINVEVVSASVDRITIGVIEDSKSRVNGGVIGFVVDRINDEEIVDDILDTDFQEISSVNVTECQMA